MSKGAVQLAKTLNSVNTNKSAASKITHLELADNMVASDQKGIIDIAGAALKMHHLALVDVASDHKGIIAIAGVKGIEYLGLSENGIAPGFGLGWGGGSVTSLVDALKRNTSIVSLDLRGNYLTENECEIFLDYFVETPTLRSFQYFFDVHLLSEISMRPVKQNEQSTKPSKYYPSLDINSITRFELVSLGKQSQPAPVKPQTPTAPAAPTQQTRVTGNSSTFFQQLAAFFSVVHHQKSQKLRHLNSNSHTLWA